MTGSARSSARPARNTCCPTASDFPSSLPTILAHSGREGLLDAETGVGILRRGGGPESLEKTPEGTPFNVGVWVGPDGESVLAGLNPGSYSGGIDTDLSKPLPARAVRTPRSRRFRRSFSALRQKLRTGGAERTAARSERRSGIYSLRSQQKASARYQQDRDQDRYQDDWAARVEHNGKVSGVFTDYHYYGTGDIGGAPDEESVKRLEAIVTKGTTSLPPQGELLIAGSRIRSGLR